MLFEAAEDASTQAGERQHIKKVKETFRRSNKRGDAVTFMAKLDHQNRCFELVNQIFRKPIPPMAEYVPTPFKVLQDL